MSETLGEPRAGVARVRRSPRPGDAEEATDSVSGQEFRVRAGLRDYERPISLLALGRTALAALLSLGLCVGGIALVLQGGPLSGRTMILAGAVGVVLSFGLSRRSGHAPGLYVTATPDLLHFPARISWSPIRWRDLEALEVAGARGAAVLSFRTSQGSTALLPLDQLSDPVRFAAMLCEIGNTPSLRANLFRREQGERIAAHLARRTRAVDGGQVVELSAGRIRMSVVNPEQYRTKVVVGAGAERGPDGERTEAGIGLGEVLSQDMEFRDPSVVVLDADGTPRRLRLDGTEADSRFE
ncbi:hypothetical protein [Segniliparus rugosus]|uniref:Uncharacterized protein n=1 Tax=Segniliparus rugosus (strain ATCC BAA-974 / DSM 45345 / CCUG 50838 / CIP 108380 / JCM 13579 / CDC 945) TaxID=679197 RepID=E5XPS1_SEGRC|nr:hypothetical protein [Segniliparus rugosus]EFV13669.1 hypothetical protein HMPREF9336_01493 [Segniliparus rugosus ATCC BAA-974]